MDKRILETIIVKFGGGPVGVNSIAAAVGEEADTLEEVYEPFLIMEGYLQRTPQGRTATELGHQRLIEDGRRGAAITLVTDCEQHSARFSKKPMTSRPVFR